MANPLTYEPFMSPFRWKWIG